ncbi:MAG: pyridoxamine 5'-phosphate oxidase family protein [Sphaerobacteraceae bacterium]|nr:MAG: pyridoxamine 5'-phosphate oxidase family protein [Sphaerobacteraceae bacterium]
MHETADDIRSLQMLIDESVELAGPFLRHSFDMPALSLSAGQIIRRLEGSVTLALGTVTSDGRPRVAPVIALFYRGQFFIPTVRTALRTRHVQNNAEVSLSLYEGNDFAIIVHGQAVVIDSEHQVFDSLVNLQIEVGAGDVRTWGDAVFIKVDAERLYSFARFPDQFPAS